MPNIYHPRLRPTAPLSHSDNQKVPHVFPNPCWALDWRLKVPLCPMCHSEGIWILSRGKTRISGSLSCGAREVRSLCAWRGGARHGSRVMGAGDPGLIPGSGRSPGEGNGNQIQYSCLQNHMDRGAWRATVHGITKSYTRLSSSILAWRIPGMGEPGGLPSMGSHRVGHH